MLLLKPDLNKMPIELPTDYQLRLGLNSDRPLIVKFLNLTYQELFPKQPSFPHLAETVKLYLSSDTPFWLVEFEKTKIPIACLWMGNAIDQITGDRYAHIFLVYVLPQHRRLGIGKALINYARSWARSRGDRQIGLQVFVENQGAIALYQNLGFQTQSLVMIERLITTKN